MSELVPAGHSPDTRTPDLEPAEVYRAALDLLKETASQLYDLVEANPDDLDGLARTALLVEVIRKHLAMVEERAKRLMHDASPSYTFVIPGVGAWQRTKSGGYPKWDEQAAMQRVLAESGGEFGEFLELLPEFARLSWRVTPFKDRGINPYKSGLCEKQDGEPSVRFMGVKER